MVYRCGFSSGHQTSSSFIPGWLVLLLQLKTQHPQNSVHGILFCDNCAFLHIHFCIHTLSGAVLPQELVDSNIERERSDLNLRQMSKQMQQVLEGVGDFYQLSSKSWLCSVRAEYVSPVNQKLVEGFLFRLDFGSIQHANKTFQLRACIRGQIVVIS